MDLREILHIKGHVVHTIGQNATLEDVVQKLVRNNCGSLVVRDDDSNSGRMIGIITERDILRACAKHQSPLSTLSVGEIMTTDVAIGSPTDSVEDTMGLMTRLRIRHLPVVEDGQLLGLVSIGDVVKMQHDRLTMENFYLKSYLQG
jgi:CBS domain-containing protein